MDKTYLKRLENQLLAGEMSFEEIVKSELTKNETEPSKERLRDIYTLANNVGRASDILQLEDVCRGMPKPDLGIPNQLVWGFAKAKRTDFPTGLRLARLLSDDKRGSQYLAEHELLKSMLSDGLFTRYPLGLLELIYLLKNQRSIDALKIIINPASLSWRS